jgi:signal transduction histidine kinase
MLRVERDGKVSARTPDPVVTPGTFAAALRAGGPPTLVEDFWGLDPQAYPRYRMMRQRGIRSAVNVPIQDGERRIGSLHINHRQPSFYDPSALTVAAALATQASAAIERARLEAERLDALRQLAVQAEELARRDAETAALRELDRLKDELLSTVSHELRTPLTVVQGYAHRLRVRGRSLDDVALAATAQNILSSAEQLTHLVEDLLDFARLQRGEVALRPARTDLAPVIREVVKRLHAQPGGSRLTCELPERLVAFADPERVAQIVANLVENALKYAPQGPIVVRGQQREQVVCIEVADQGPGIQPAEQPRIWE